MKTAIPLLATLLLVGGLMATASADVLSKSEFTPGNYCHLRFPAITEETLNTDHPMLKQVDSGDIIDFYGPCDENPLGQDQIAAQKLDEQHRWQNGFSD